jgi:D-glycero-alpha-D-manno-heptose-7-phosphate kinase
MIDNLALTADIGWQVRDAPESGDTSRFGALMHEHWQLKRRRTAGMATSETDRLYELAMASGAVGGKLVGAGAGGFPAVLLAGSGSIARCFRQ